MTKENGILISVTNDDIDNNGNFAVPFVITGIGKYAFDYCTSLQSISQYLVV